MEVSRQAAEHARELSAYQRAYSIRPDRYVSAWHDEEED
jgi:hypothetical protein